MNYQDAQPPGSAFGGLVLEDAIGQGGEGIVYRARHVTLGSVLVKEYWPKQVVSRARSQRAEPSRSAWQDDYRRGVERFQLLGERLAGMSHPNIMRVHEVVAARNTAYLVMEELDGVTLEAALERGAFSDPADVVNLAGQISEGLRYLHGVGLLHRDIAPDNIIITPGHDWRAVLIDFNAAKDLVARMTQSREAMVKPGYSPIEQYGAGEGEIGPWTDIYAAAAVLYRVITGKPPQDAPRRMLRSAGHDTLAALKPPGYSPAFLATVDRALAANPDDRPRSIDDWGISTEIDRTPVPAETIIAPAPPVEPALPPPASEPEPTAETPAPAPRDPKANPESVVADPSDDAPPEPDTETPSEPKVQSQSRKKAKAERLPEAEGVAEASVAEVEADRDPAPVEGADEQFLRHIEPKPSLLKQLSFSPLLVVLAGALLIGLAVTVFMMTRPPTANDDPPWMRAGAGQLVAEAALRWTREAYAAEEDSPYAEAAASDLVLAPAGFGIDHPCYVQRDMLPDLTRLLAAAEQAPGHVSLQRGLLGPGHGRMPVVNGFDTSVRAILEQLSGQLDHHRTQRFVPPTVELGNLLSRCAQQHVDHLEQLALGLLQRNTQRREQHSRLGAGCGQGLLPLAQCLAVRLHFAHQALEPALPGALLVSLLMAAEPFDRCGATFHLPLFETGPARAWPTQIEA
eukprot:gene32392-41965_t